MVHARLPVLNAVVEMSDDPLTGPPSGHQIAERTGFDKAVVARALSALDGEYLRLRMSMSGGDPGPWRVLSITPEARRAVGQCPTPERLAQTLVAELEKAAEEEPDPEKQGRFRRAAESVGGLGRDVLANVVANVITKGGMGL